MGESKWICKSKQSSWPHGHVGVEPGRYRESASSLPIHMEASPRRSSMWIPTISHHLSLFSVCPTCPSLQLFKNKTEHRHPALDFAVSFPSCLSSAFSHKTEVLPPAISFISMITTKPPPSKIVCPPSCLFQGHFAIFISFHDFAVSIMLSSPLEHPSVMYQWGCF